MRPRTIARGARKARPWTVLATALALACGGDGGGPTGPTPPVGTVDGRTARLEGLSVTLLEVVNPWPPPVETPDPDEGSQYVTAEVRYTNAGSADHLYDAGEFRVRASGTDWGTEPDWREPELGTGTLTPGLSATGWVTFQVPLGAVPTHVVWRPRAGIELAIPVGG